MTKKNKKIDDKITQLEIYKKVRKGWGDISPVTKIKPSKKKKSRAKRKKDLKKELENEI